MPVTSSFIARTSIISGTSCPFIPEFDHGYPIRYNIFMENITPKTQSDPMGLESLSAVIQRLATLKKEAMSDGSTSKRFALVVEQLEDKFLATQQKYELLKDRYALLKRSNAALCDELVWLRDQLDDLSTPGD
jgi:hypothetical protein